MATNPAITIYCRHRPHQRPGEVPSARSTRRPRQRAWRLTACLLIAGIATGVTHGGPGELIYEDDFEAGTLIAWGDAQSDPIAILNINPADGHLPLEVDLDGSLSYDPGAEPMGGPGAGIQSYAWDLGDGSTGQGAQITHLYEQAGELTVRLTVTDDDGQSSSVEGSVTVEPANQAPQAIIEAVPGFGHAPLSVGFDASQSTDPDGQVTRWIWDFGDGQQADGATVQHLYPNPGIYEISLTVRDDDGAEDSTTAQIIVQIANLAPIARILASPTSGTPPLEVQLDASTSSDADGGLVAFVWQLGDGDTGQGTVLSHTYDQAGSYELHLEVTDDDGARGTAQLTITVDEVPVSPPVIDPFISPTRDPSIQLAGSSGAGHQIEIEGGGETMQTPADGEGRWSANVDLQPNRRNRFFVSAVDSGGQRSSPVAVDVMHDAEAPDLSIDFPPHGAALSADQVTVAGRVGDRLSGELGLAVTVQGQPANVVVGLGANGSFDLANVELQPGENQISATATDAAGNQASAQLTVFRSNQLGARLETISGDGQQGQVGSLLAQPLTVRAVEADGSPLANKLVQFSVTRSDGWLASGEGAQPPTTGQRTLQVRTDTQGEAGVQWILGSDAGCANQRVEVSSAGLAGTLYLVASADPLPGNRIVPASGNDQRGQSGAELSEPLRAWVSDGRNGIPGVAVTFSVISGEGDLVLAPDARHRLALDDPRRGPGRSSQLTVHTGPTGHAEVTYRLGALEGAQLVQADFPGNPAAAAEFLLNAQPGQTQVTTTFSGQVVDNGGRGVEGAICRLQADGVVHETTSDGDGLFLLSDLPDGPAHLEIDGQSALAVGGESVPAGSFPRLTYALVLVPRAANRLPGPIKLPPLDPANGRLYDGTMDLTLGMAGYEGLELKVQAGSVRLADGTLPSPAQPVMLSLDPVHFDDLPMPLPDGAAPPIAWTLQPAGATFDPPAQIRLPNMAGLSPGAEAYFLSFDHDTERFEIVSTGRVTEDGESLISDLGRGLTLAGWGGFCPPYPNLGGVEHDPMERTKELLQEDYEAKQGTAAAGLSWQVRCLGQKACGSGGPAGRPSWARGFVPPLLADVARNRRDNPSGADQRCANIPQWLDLLFTLGLYDSTDLCALAGGFYHFRDELEPGFARHMRDQLEDAKRRGLSVSDAKAAIRVQHQRFLQEGVQACFDENEEMSLLPRRIARNLVPRVAANARESVLEALCRDTSRRPAVPRLTRQALFSSELAEISELSVSAPLDAFFFEVGSQVQLQVHDEEGNDLSSAASGTRYWAIAHEDEVSISADGLLTVHATPSPQAEATPLLYVYVGNGERLGIGQFALRARDQDGDLVADSWEPALGLDPMVDDGFSDTDGDGLPAPFEVFADTDPSAADSDQDGVHDGEEMDQGSDPLDPEQIQPVLTWGGRVSLAGRWTDVASDGGFRLNNLPAGSNLVRVQAQSEARGLGAAGVVGDRNGQPLYGSSTFFEIRAGQTSVFDEPIALSSQRPPSTLSLDLQTSTPTLTVLGQSVQLAVNAQLSDGNVVDVTSRALGSTYTSSNPSVLSVDREGMVTAEGSGSAAITVLNEGAAAVLRLAVAPGDPLTTVEGLARDPFGLPADSAQVSLPNLGRETNTDNTGAFSFQAVPSQQPGALDLFVRASSSLGLVVAHRTDLVAVPGGITDAGLLQVAPWQGEDSDDDGVPDSLESFLGTDPQLADTDGDGTVDGEEDGDGDGSPDLAELLLGTDPLLNDSDGDGILDGLEDSDADGLLDLVELAQGTDPFAVDTDGDGFGDSEELLEGSDPRDGASQPLLAPITVAVAHPVSLDNREVPQAELASASARPLALFNDLAPAAPAAPMTTAAGRPVSVLNTLAPVARMGSVSGRPVSIGNLLAPIAPLGAASSPLISLHNSETPDPGLAQSPSVSLHNQESPNP